MTKRYVGGAATWQELRGLDSFPRWHGTTIPACFWASELVFVTQFSSAELYLRRQPHASSLERYCKLSVEESDSEVSKLSLFRVICSWRDSLVPSEASSVVSHAKEDLSTR